MLLTASALPNLTLPVGLAADEVELVVLVVLFEAEVTNVVVVDSANG